jgi:hypothetical protein
LFSPRSFGHIAGSRGGVLGWCSIPFELDESHVDVLDVVQYGFDDVVIKIVSNVPAISEILVEPLSHFVNHII